MTNITDKLALDDAMRTPVNQLSDDELLVTLATPSSVEEAASTLGRAYANGQLVQVVRTLIGGLDQLGFNDPEASVSGGDCIEFICEMLPSLRGAVADLGGQSLGAEEDEAERNRLVDFLVSDWNHSFSDDADQTFGAIERVLRTGHIGYEHMPIGELRCLAEDAGYEGDLEDAPHGMSP